MEDPVNVGFYFKIISDSTSALANRLGKESDLTISQASVLGYLAHRRGQATSQQDIGNYLSLSHATVGGVLKRMEAKGLVAIEPDPVDRRRKNVVLDEVGTHASLALQETYRQLDEYITFGLTAREEKQLSTLLQKVITGMRTQEKLGRSTQ